MRALLPRSDPEVDLAEAYAVPSAPGAVASARPADVPVPFVRATMISSLDGAVSVRGRSGPLGGGADRKVFGVLRSLADVVLVGAGTVRAEGYGPVHLDDGLRRARVRRGQREAPPIAVVTRSGRLDWDDPFFTSVVSRDARPIVYAPATVVAQVPARAGEVADLVAGDEARAGVDDDAAEEREPGTAPGRQGVDVRRVLADLAARGHRSVLLEGGPELNAAAAAAGVLDELCLTVAPRLTGGGGPGVLGSAPLAQPISACVLHLLEEDGFFFYRLALTAPEGARG